MQGQNIVRHHIGRIITEYPLRLHGFTGIMALMDRLRIAHLRLFHQRLSASTFQRPAEVVGWLAAIQAQDYAGARWGVGQRLLGANDSNIEQAFNQGLILRTHLLRPTWHFVLPEDIRWLLALTAPRVRAVSAGMYRKLGLDETIFARSNAALAGALQGGNSLTRPELRQALEQAGVDSTGDQRLSYLLMQAELDGIVCSGPRRERQFTYALLEERAPQARQLARDEALSELSRRYFTSRGPASVHDFARWSGLTLADARRGLAAVESGLERATLNDQTYWFSPETPSGLAGPSAYLLSIYDEYISGYKDRSAVIEAALASRLSALGNDLTAIIVLDSQVVGVWKRVLGKTSVQVKMQALTPLDEAGQQAVTRAAERYAAFLKLPLA